MFGSSSRVQVILGVAWILAGLLLMGQWLINRPSIKILWQTETEFDSAGFNVLRGNSETGPFTKSNDRLLPASNDAAAGAEYSFVDTEVTAGQLYYYQLEDVDFYGNTTRHEPIAFEAPGRANWLLALGGLMMVVGTVFLVSAWTRARMRIAL